MFSDVLKYSGIYAKTSALNAALIKYDDYHRLASCENVKDFAEALGEVPAYKESAAEAIAYGANRVAIERSLLTSLYRDFGALYGFITDGDSRKYLDAVFLQYVIEIIKRIIRRIFDHRKALNIIPKYGEFMSAHTGLNLAKIAVSPDMDALIENVRGSDIYSVLSKINRQTATLFDYETQLDFYGLMKRHKYQEKHLKGEALRACRHLNGSEADLLNILWIYRSKEFYQITNDTLYTYLIPIHYKLSTETIKALVAAEDRHGFIEILESTHYKGVFSNLSGDGMEKDLRAYLDKQYKAYHKTFSLMSVISHLYFKRREISNLTTLIECVRYRLSPSSALSRVHIAFTSENVSV